MILAPDLEMTPAKRKALIGSDSEDDFTTPRSVRKHDGDGDTSLNPGPPPPQSPVQPPPSSSSSMAESHPAKETPPAVDMVSMDVSNMKPRM